LLVGPTDEMQVQLGPLSGRQRDRGAMALQLVLDDALALSDIEGSHRNPGHVSRPFARDIERCGEVPAVRLHDLRRTHATILLTAREPVGVVAQRLGHAGPVVTMTVFAHVLPGSQRDAARLSAELAEGAKRRRGSRKRLSGIRRVSRRELQHSHLRRCRVRGRT
jgi:hypothetical protein